MGFHNYTNENNNANSNQNTPTIPNMPIASAPQANSDILDMLIDYNAKFKNAGTTLHRESVVRQIFSILIGYTKPNPLLIGAAGVGKTRIIEDLAFRIVTKDPTVPVKLQNAHIYELPISNIVAGSSHVGELEEKLQNVIDFIQDPTQKNILFIDEIHLLEGHSNVYNQIAQLLKPVLARKNSRIIGATTTQEYNDIADDPAFQRRFTKVIVPELSQTQTVDVLNDVSQKILKYHSKLQPITLAPDLIEKTVQIADTNKIPGSHRPDSAITLLDRSIANAIMLRQYQITEAQKMNNAPLLQALKANPIITVTEKNVRDTSIKLMTGTIENADIDYEKLQENLQVIKGQDYIIEQLIKALKNNDLGIFKKPHQPLGIIFAGYSGTGKTETAKIIAQTITGTKPIMLNMTEYNNDSMINRIIGSPDGYVGSDSKKELPFDCLESNPYQIICLDEFEKAAPSVQRLFMGILEEGILKTARGKEIDFSKAIIIATTNAGHHEMSNRLGFGSTEPESTELTPRQILSLLTKDFDAALLNRFSEKLVFNPITQEIYGEILQQIYTQKVKEIKTRKPKIKLNDTLTDDEINELTKQTFVPASGARPALHAIGDLLSKKLI